MILFTGVRSFHDEFFLCFSNEHGSSIEIPVSDKMKDWFMRYIDRLSPPINDVENQKLTSSE